MKSKKMTKSTFAIIIMAVAMVAMLAFGGTYAYFTSTAAEKVATISTGKIEVSSAGIALDATYSNILPGDTILPAGSVVTVSADSEASYVAIKVACSVDGVTLVPDAATWFEVGDDTGIYVYGASNKATSVAKGGTAVINAADIKFVAADTSVEGSTGTFTNNGIMGQTGLQITINAVSIQAAHVADTAAPALLAGLFDQPLVDGPNA